MVHTKIMVMEALLQLHEEADMVLYNWNYRGPMEKIPTFNMKQIAKKISRTPQTVLKWCHILKKEGLINMGFQRRYGPSDSCTYICNRNDVKPRKLKKYIEGD